MKPDTLYAARTLYDGSALLEEREVLLRPAAALDENTLLIDPRVRHQPMLGFGGTWTDTDVYNLLRMSPEKQEEVLTALFDPEKGAGWNFMRLPFGSTDWESTYDFYTYDDMPRGEKDRELSHFSIQRDIDRGLFTLARRCREINPEMVFLGSVWGVPGWMKDNDSIMHGIFDPQYTEVYARYIRRTVEAYAQQGVELYAITPQNESLISEDRATPACRFTWRLQRDVVLALRKEFSAHHIKTEIWAYDDTFSKAPWFVTPLLEDEAARKALDGVAYHNYGGRTANMGEAARDFSLPVYMTERCPHDVPAYIQMLEQLQNEARSYLSWTTLCNEFGGPHQGGDGKRPYMPFPHRGYYAFITNRRDDPDDWTKTPMYGLFAQFSRYIRRGMVRVDCTPGCRGWITAAAFRDETTGETVCVAANGEETPQSCVLRCGSREAALTLAPKSVETWRFLPEGEPLPLSAAPGKTLPSEPSWDMEAGEITWQGTLRAGEKLLFACTVKNVGELPIPPRSTVVVQFNLDGDEPVARGAYPCPALAPGEAFTVTANVPYGRDICWTATPGWHTLIARVFMGGDIFPEKETDNNINGREFFIEG